MSQGDKLSVMSKFCRPNGLNDDYFNNNVLHTLPTKVHILKAMVFPVVKYRYESWTIKKAEC